MHEVNMKAGIQLSHFNFSIIKSHIRCVHYKSAHVGDGCIHPDHHNSGAYSSSRPHHPWTLQSLFERCHKLRSCTKSLRLPLDNILSVGQILACPQPGPLSGMWNTCRYSPRSQDSRTISTLNHTSRIVTRQLLNESNEEEKNHITCGYSALAALGKFVTWKPARKIWLLDSYYDEKANNWRKPIKCHQ